MRNLFVSMIVVFLFVCVSLPAIAQDPEPEYMERYTHSGNDQRAPVGTTLNAPFRVVVRDEDDNRLLGVTVNFSVDKGGTLSATSATTSGFNRTAETTLTFSNTPGLYTVTASVTGLQPVSFTAFATTPTNLEKWTDSDSDPVIRSDHQTGVVSTALEYDFVVKVTDQERMPYEGATVNFTVSPSSGSLSHASRTSNSTGRARTKLTLGSTTGTYTVTARVSGISGSVTFTATATETAAAAVRYHSGMEQSGVVRQELADPLIVKVTNTGGDAVENARVNFSFGSGSPRGTLNPTTARTDADGLARTKLTFGSTAGEYIVNATVPDILQEHARTSIFSVYASSPPPPPEPLAPTVVTSVEVVSGTGQTARINQQLSRPLIFVAKNQQGGGVANATLNFSVNPTTGTVNPTSATTDSSGRAQTVLTLGDNPGVYTVIATTFGVTQPAAITATATVAPAASSLRRAPGDNGNNQTAQPSQRLTDPLVVIVRDQNGNPFSGATVTFALGASNPATATLSPTSTRTNSSGLAQTRLTLGSAAGTYTVTASVADLTDVTFMATAAAAETLTATTIERYSGSGQSGQVSQQLANPLVVIVKDQNGNPFSGAQVSFSVESGGGSVSPPTATTNSSGLAQTRLTLGSTAGTSNNTVLASIVGVTATSASFLASATATTPTPVTPTVNTLAVYSGDTQKGKRNRQLANPLIVRVLDQSGNRMSGVRVTFAFKDGSPTGRLSPTRATTGANGLAQTRLTLGSDVGEYTVTASVESTLPLEPAEFTANTTKPTTIEIVSGSGQTAGPNEQLSSPLIVLVKDEEGDAFPGATVDFSVTPKNGILNPTSAVTSSNGRAQTRLTLGAVGTSDGVYEVTASVSGVSDPVEFRATLLDEGYTMEIVSGDGQTGVVNRQVADPLVVVVKDVNNNPVSGVMVTFDAKSGSVSPTSARTNSRGQAQTRLTLGPNTHAHDVFVRAVGVGGGAVFTITAATEAAGDPAAINLEIDGAYSQGQNIVNKNKSVGLTATVTDANGIPVSGATVSFSAALSSAPTTPVVTGEQDTDSNGRSTVSVTPPAAALAGDYIVTATVSGNITDTVTVKAVTGPIKIEIVSGNEEFRGAGSSVSLVVVVKDANDAPISGARVVFSVPTSDPDGVRSFGTVSPATAVTRSNGQASTSFRLGSTPGIYTANAEVTIINQQEVVGFKVYATGTVTRGNYRLIKVTSDPINANYGDDVEITVRVSPVPTEGSGAGDLNFYIGSFGGGNLFTTVPTGLTMGTPGAGANPGEKVAEVSISSTATIPDLEPNVEGKTFKVMVDFAIGGVNGTRYFRDSEGEFSSEPINQPAPVSFTVRVTEPPASAAPAAIESLLPPSETLLLPNYPNPFNPETWIPYQLSEPADVALTIYNLRGVMVREIKLGHQAAGLYRSRSRAIHWDGRNAFGERVVSGVYFYMLKAGEFSATRKLLILK